MFVVSYLNVIAVRQEVLCCYNALGNTAAMKGCMWYLQGICLPRELFIYIITTLFIRPGQHFYPYVLLFKKTALM